MIPERCSLCHKSVERAALVGCHEVRCPLARTPQRVSLKTSVGIALAGMAAFAGLFVVGSLATRTSAADTPKPVRSIAAKPGKVEDAPRPVAQSNDRSVVAWLMSVFETPKPPEPESVQVALPDQTRPDLRAATRVQSFSCTGELPASRALMCTRWDLATADYNLALSYKSALAHARNPRALRRARAAWLKELDRLDGDAKKVLLHIEAFQHRIAAA